MEFVVGSVFRKNTAKGKPYLVVKPRGSDKAYWVWHKVDEAQGMLVAGASVKVTVEDEQAEYPRIVQIAPSGGPPAAASSLPAPVAPQSATAQPTEVTRKDVSVLTSYLKDLRVAGKSRVEALQVVRESLEDAQSLLSGDVTSAAKRSVMEWGPRLGVNLQSEAWAKHLAARFPSGPPDWYAVLYDLQGVQDGAKVVRVSAAGAYEFVDAPQEVK